MPTAVDQILAYNALFDKNDLPRKLDKLIASPFQFYRGTFHLFASDMKRPEFRTIPMTCAAGPIVGDLHSQNFGIFRAVRGGLSADVNDFDETTTGPYEFDLRRLATSLMLAASGPGSTIAPGIAQAEECVRSYLGALDAMRSIRDRDGFDALKSTMNIKLKPRIAFIKSLITDLHFRESDQLQPVDARTLTSLRDAFPQYRETCVPADNKPASRYRFVAAASRIAGIGSLGRKRFAILMCIEKGEPCIENLRLVEWKQSLDSACDSPLPNAEKTRAKQVVHATMRFQLYTKRFIGYTRVGKMPMQARELGVNDQPLKVQSNTYGEIAARAHLLGSGSKTGPRALLKEIAGREEEFVHRVLHFSMAYTARTLSAYRELLSREKEVRRSWSA